MWIKSKLKKTTSVTTLFRNNKHLKNVGPILHCEPPHAACLTLPFTMCRYCRTPTLSHVACASMSTTTSKTTTTTTTRDRGDRYGPMEWAQQQETTCLMSQLLSKVTFASCSCYIKCLMCTPCC